MVCLEYGSILKNSFLLWYKDSKIWQYIAYYLVLNLLFYALAGGIAFFLFGDIFSRFMSLVPNGAAANPVIVSQMVSLFLTNMVIFLLIFVPLVLLYSLVIGFIGCLMNLRALSILGIEPAQFDLNKFLRLIVLELWISIASLISWYNRKFMYAFIGMFLLTLLGTVLLIVLPIAGVILLLLLMLAWLLYGIVVIYNALRLRLGSVIFLHKDFRVSEAARESIAMSQGKVLEIFIASLLAGVAVGAISFIAGIPAMFIRLGFELMGNPLAGFAVDFGSNILIAPFLAAIGAFIMPSIYSELLKPGQQPSAGTPIAPAASTSQPTQQY